MSVLDAVKAPVQGGLFGSDPASAYPHQVARLLPGAWGFWSTAAIIITAVVAVVGGLTRRVEGVCPVNCVWWSG